MSDDSAHSLAHLCPHRNQAIERAVPQSASVDRYQLLNPIKRHGCEYRVTT